MAWFHVSDVDLGPSIKLWPRVPLRRAPDEDAGTPRICVAPSIDACLRMVAWNDGVDDFHVYQLVTNPERAGLDVEGPLRNVPDLGRSRRHVEAWLTKAATFEKIGVVTMNRVDLVTGRPCFWWGSKKYAHLSYDGEMSDQQVKAYQQHLEVMRRVAAEMEAEIRAKGGKMISDFFVGR